VESVGDARRGVLARQGTAMARFAGELSSASFRTAKAITRNAPRPSCSRIAKDFGDVLETALPQTSVDRPDVPLNHRA
jgi:hypothetical protein